MNSVDFGKTATDYGKHRAGFPAEFFWELRRAGIGLPGQVILDLGTGTGTLARGFARHGCQVTGIDLSESMLSEARRLAQADGARIDFLQARAESTGLPAGTFDVVSAGQCWHWFDRAAAAAECRRLLRPGGVLVIAHFDWIPLPGNVVEATEQLIVRHNPQWKFGGGSGIHTRQLTDAARAGFEALRTFSFDLDVPYTHEDWRGRVRASAGIGPALSPEEVARFDAEHAALLAAHFPRQPMGVLHRVWALLARKPADQDLPHTSATRASRPQENR